MKIWMLTFAVLGSCSSSMGDAVSARSGEDGARDRERAQAVCGRLCAHNREMSSQLGCEPLSVGCEEACLIAFPTKMLGCMDEVEAESRCIEDLPESAYSCSARKGNALERLPTGCASETASRRTCLRKPRGARRPPYVGPTPPPPDRSRPEQRFCTPLPGAKIEDVQYYQHAQARPSGWEIETVREENGETIYCFQQIPENPLP